MSCVYPSCMMGGGSCPDATECDRIANDRYQVAEEKRQLDIEEQKARIAHYKANAPIEQKEKP